MAAGVLTKVLSGGERHVTGMELGAENVTREDLEDPRRYE